MKLIDRSILLDVLWRSDCSTREKIDEIVNRQYVYKDMISIDELQESLNNFADNALKASRESEDKDFQSYMLGKAHAYANLANDLELNKER